MRGDRSACPPAPGRDSHLILSVLRLGGLTLKTSFGFGLTLSLLSLVSCRFFFFHIKIFTTIWVKMDTLVCESRVAFCWEDPHSS